MQISRLYSLCCILIYFSFTEAKRIRAYGRYKSIFNESVWDNEIQPVLEDLVREERQRLKSEQATSTVISSTEQPEAETLKPIKITVIKSATIPEKPKMPLKTPTKPEKSENLAKKIDQDFRLKRKIKAKVFPRKPRDNGVPDEIPKLNAKFFIRTARLLDDRKAIIDELAKNEKFNRNSRKKTTILPPIEAPNRGFDSLLTEKSLEILNEDLTPEEIDDIIGAAILKPTLKPEILGNQAAKTTNTRIFEYPLSRTATRKEENPSIPPFQPPIDEPARVKTIEDNIKEFIQFRTTTTIPRRGPTMDLVRIDGAERPVLAKSIPIAAKTIEELRAEDQEILKGIEATLEQPPNVISENPKQLMLPAQIPINEVPLDPSALAKGKLVIQSEKSKILGKIPYSTLSLGTKEVTLQA